MTSEVAPQRYVYANTNLKTLGIVWVAYGLLRLLLAVWLAVFSATAR
jgi:hypothetical protein